MRTEAEIRDWAAERQDFERRSAPENSNTPAGGMAMGALETLDPLLRYLNGDDEA